ncbi:MAG: hypothetical protein NkDv07_0613 [Candidatus Improbicoccus devescovinae]|nr:MAG: hypothetical protein NkDv07_0613 [Candidatus Improbicoccus devescovinae]
MIMRIHKLVAYLLLAIMVRYNAYAIPSTKKKSEITASWWADSHENSNKYKNIALRISLGLGGVMLAGLGLYLGMAAKKSDALNQGEINRHGTEQSLSLDISFYPNAADSLLDLLKKLTNLLNKEKTSDPVPQESLTMARLFYAEIQKKEVKLKIELDDICMVLTTGRDCCIKYKDTAPTSLIEACLPVFFAMTKLACDYISLLWVQHSPMTSKEINDIRHDVVQLTINICSITYFVPVNRESQEFIDSKTSLNLSGTYEEIVKKLNALSYVFHRSRPEETLEKYLNSVNGLRWPRRMGSAWIADNTISVNELTSGLTELESICIYLNSAQHKTRKPNQDIELAQFYRVLCAALIRIQLENLKDTDITISQRREKQRRIHILADWFTTSARQHYDKAPNWGLTLIAFERTQKDIQKFSYFLETLDSSKLKNITKP